MTSSVFFFWWAAAGEAPQPLLSSLLAALEGSVVDFWKCGARERERGRER